MNIDIQKNSKYQDYYNLKGRLSASDLLELEDGLSWIKHLPQRKQTRSTENKRQNTLYSVIPSQPLRQQLEEKFSKVFPFEKKDYQFYSINYYELQNPYGLHCDNLPNGRGFYQAVVPLRLDPVDSKTYTIIFDQTATENSEWISPAFSKPKDYKPFHNKPIYDANWFGGYRANYQIPDEDGYRYWGSSWDSPYRKAYKGFSIKYAYEWNPGDVLIFNSKFTHCASELAAFGIKQKTGLLICLETRK